MVILLLRSDIGYNDVVDLDSDIVTVRPLGLRRIMGAVVEKCDRITLIQTTC